MTGGGKNSGTREAVEPRPRFILTQIEIQTWVGVFPADTRAG